MNRVVENGLVYPELKWMVAIFEWIDRIQNYFDNASNSNYMSQLKLFVERGAIDLDFFDSVSSLVARGCYGIHCSSQPIPFMDQRRSNFEKLIYDVFDIQSSLKVVSSGTVSSTSTNQEPQYNYEYAEKWLQSKRSKIESNILVSQNEALDGKPYFSTAYKFNHFISALRSSALYGLAQNKVFFLYDSSKGSRGFNAGLVNLAIFLANVMVESIVTDSCDEVNWESDPSGNFSPSNSCGQNGRNYSMEICPKWQSFMTCNVNPQMEMEAEIPITDKAPFLLNMIQTPFKCYPGNETARSDVEGCCFWGR